MGRILSVKEKDEFNRGPGCWQFKTLVKNAEDYKKLALLLSDLSSLGLPIDKAIKEYTKLKEEAFPF